MCRPIRRYRIQPLCRIHPVGDVVIAVRLVARMPPQAVLDMTDCVHVEGIEADFSDPASAQRAVSTVTDLLLAPEGY